MGTLLSLIMLISGIIIFLLQGKMNISKKFLSIKRCYLSITFFFRQCIIKKYGYYATKNPLGYKSDFITSPLISTLFSEMILIWLVSTWQNLGKPKKINIVELGPEMGLWQKIIIESSQNLKIFLMPQSFFCTKKVYI